MAAKRSGCGIAVAVVARRAQKIAAVVTVRCSVVRCRVACEIVGIAARERVRSGSRIAREAIERIVIVADSRAVRFCDAGNQRNRICAACIGERVACAAARCRVRDQRRPAAKLVVCVSDRSSVAVYLICEVVDLPFLTPI